MKRKTMVMVALGVVLLMGAYGISELTMEQQSEFVHPADQIRASLEHISLVRSAIESGDEEGALAKLDQVQTLLEKAHASVRPAVANIKCPMTGTQIDPMNIPDSQYRTFRGHGVGFDSPASAEAWQELSDDQKVAKLSGVLRENVAIPTQQEFEKSMIEQRVSQCTGCEKGCQCAKCQAMRTKLSQKAGLEEATAKLTDIDTKVSEMTGHPVGCSCVKCQASRVQLKAAGQLKPEKITGIGEVEE